MIAKRRRTWKLRLCAAWIGGTTFGILDIRNRFRPGTAEREVRQLSQTRAWREARRMSRRIQP